MNIVYCIVYHIIHLRDILSKLGLFILLKRKFSYDPATKPSNFSIYFVKSFLKSHSFWETKASSTVSFETNRGKKIILYILGVAMYTKLISRMVLRTQEKSSLTALLRYSYPQIELSSKITRDSQETIHNAATFLKIGFSYGQSFLIFARFSE